MQLAHHHGFKPEPVSFAQFRARVVHTAHNLKLFGVRKGARCAFLCDTTLAALINIMASVSLGAVAAIINYKIPIHTLSHMLKR